MAAAYKLLIDWLGNGFADIVKDDVTARVLDQRTPVTVKYGRNQARQFSPIEPGEANFEINNISRDYSPENATSPLAGYVAPGRDVVFQATLGTTTTVLYRGRLDDFDIKPGLNDRSVPGSCMDGLGSLKGVGITTSLYRGLRTGEAIGLLLDAVGWAPDARDLDLGVSYLPYWWLDDTDAYDALMQLVDSEGGPAMATVDSQGRLVFRDRHHRLTRPASLTAQATWRSSGIEPCISDPVTYNHGWSEIVNSVSVEVPNRFIGGSLSSVWSSTGQITIPAGATVWITAQSSTAFLGALTPEAGVDYAIVSGTVDSINITRTSGQSTSISIYSAAGAVVDGMGVRAYQVNFATSVITVEDPVSIGKFGRKSMSDLRLPTWANTYDAEAILQLIVAKRSDRLATLQVTMRGAGHSLRLAECLGRNLSDRVHLTESLTGLDSDCFIEQIQHTVGQGGLEHVTTFGVEKSQVVVSAPFQFDVAGRGFNDGRFASGTLDNPATMLRFDTAGQGFDDGLFAT